MVAGSRIEGGTQIISAGVRKTIQSIKEIVGNYSDIDIYWALKETDMDPNETAQKLLNQDPFHVVKRKRDKRKEVSSNSNGHKVPVDARRHSESAGQGPKPITSSDRPSSQNTTSDHPSSQNTSDRPSSHNTFPDRPSSRNTFSDHPSSRNTFSDRNVRRGGYARGGSTANDRLFLGTRISREFRVVRDNRINGNVNKEAKPASPKSTTSTNEQASNNSGKGFVFTFEAFESCLNGRVARVLIMFPGAASQPNKEWKPKSSQKASSNSPGVIGTPTKSVSPASGDPQVSESEAAKLQDKLALVNIYDNCNVVIAHSIRVPDSDRFQLTFGSLGTEPDSRGNIVNGFQVGASEESNREAAASLSVSAAESCSDEASGINPVDLLDHQVSSGSDSPASGVVAEHQLPENKETLSPQNLGNYADIGLVQDNSSSYAPSDSQQQDPPELQGFSAFDPQTGYDMPYFRPNMEENRGQGLPPPQEALSSHTINSMAASTVAMVQQQPPPVAQMYPQVHVSHYANLMPYRQFLSPVYVPPMAVPGYSNNPAYPHLSNGSSYLLMPGGGSHLNANSLKYGVQQFKPAPAGSPTGFGNFTNPNGYAMNAPGVVGGATGLEDSSRIKYKDGNLYIPNPQAATSEIWIQNAREHPGMQSTPYYNMPAQSPHGAYMPSHAAHASFNAAAAQSSHMQFPGLYHPPQPTAIPNAHHMGPAMGGNVGVGVAAASPGAQVGAYQQPQLNHMNWQSNF
ncbi:hypothetical protein C1H46_021530 [Malus baccata]|uniref:GBF-interacting protein 1 N-terminal domain-containing protein n=1 Tax=Malus baccata TaxID=106549 RepID=A0A540M286_MALBA|nr:hypothetical protein C1H46_021530 [Malus baccata]